MDPEHAFIRGQERFSRVLTRKVSGLGIEAKYLSPLICTLWKRGISCYRKLINLSITYVLPMLTYQLDILALGTVLKTLAYTFARKLVVLLYLISKDIIELNIIEGHLYNYQTKKFYNLSYAQEPPEGPAKFGVLDQLLSMFVSVLGCPFI